MDTQLLKHITDYRAVLFLGAGCSLGAIHPPPKKMPTAQGLSDILAREFLTPEHIGRPLASNAEAALCQTGLFEVQKFIHDYFIDFAPSEGHKLLSCIPWRAIFTTNYDMLVEKAYKENKKAVQRIVPILSDDNGLEVKLESTLDLPYFKIHGCISEHQNANIPLILTPDQFIEAHDNRESMFKSLFEMARNHFIIYIGTSLADYDIRETINSVIKDARGKQMRSYLITPDVTDIDIQMWSGRRITALRYTFDSFMLEIAKHFNETQIVFSINKQSTSHEIYEYMEPEYKENSKLNDSFIEKDAIFISKEMNSPTVEPLSFYRGYCDGFGPIEQNLDIYRKMADVVSEKHVFHNESITNKQQLVIITGYAGSGKSIMLRRLAYDAATVYDRRCLWIENTQWKNYDIIKELYKRFNKRIFIFIDNFSLNLTQITKLMNYAAANNIEITVISTERSNLLNSLEETIEKYKAYVYRITYLCDEEIDSLLFNLAQHNALGYLSTLTLDERKKSFKKHHDSQLLVALYEATEGRVFEEIIHDEYSSIYPDEARNLYKAVCILNMANIKVRAGLISRMHSISLEDFKDKLFKPLEHIVYSVYDKTIRDRVYKSRHRKISEMVCEIIFMQPEDVYMEFHKIITALNMDYSSDKMALMYIANAKNLANIVKNYDMIKNILEAAINTDPKNPFILQQLAINEMNFSEGDLNRSNALLEQALGMRPDDAKILHSKVMLYNAFAKRATTAIEKHHYRKQAKEAAKKIFDRDIGDAYPQTTYVSICIDELEDCISVGNEAEIENKMAELEKVITKFERNYPFSDYLRTTEARYFDIIKDHTKALSALEKAFNLDTANVYSAIRLSRYYSKMDMQDKSIEVLVKALEFHPDNKDLNFALARQVMGEFCIVNDEITYRLKNSYSMADNRYEARFWHARALYLTGKISESKELFAMIDRRNIRKQDIYKASGVVYENEIRKIFNGTVVSYKNDSILIKPDLINDQVYSSARFLDCSLSRDFSVGMRFSFNLAFNFLGPIGIDLRIL